MKLKLLRAILLQFGYLDVAFGDCINRDIFQECPRVDMQMSFSLICGRVLGPWFGIKHVKDVEFFFLVSRAIERN